MPLHPTQYAALLGEKIRAHNTEVWLINTGWTGGGFGVGKRISLTHTRALIRAALTDALDPDVMTYQSHPVFGLAIPISCSAVPVTLLNPRDTWTDPAAYDQQAAHVWSLFEAKRQEIGLL